MSFYESTLNVFNTKHFERFGALVQIARNNSFSPIRALNYTHSLRWRGYVFFSSTIVSRSYAATGIRAHVSRVAADWDLRRILFRLSYTAVDR